MLNDSKQENCSFSVDWVFEKPPLAPQRAFRPPLINFCGGNKSGQAKGLYVVGEIFQSEDVKNVNNLCDSLYYVLYAEILVVPAVVDSCVAMVTHRLILVSLSGYLCCGCVLQF